MNKNLAKNGPRRWLYLVIGAAMILAVACGAGASSGQSAGDVSDSAVPVASAANDSSTGSGLDKACVQRVLGRSVTGFADVSAAERDLIFQQCSGDEQEQRQRQLGGAAGTNILENIDPACVTQITGQDELDLVELSLDQRQQVFEECLPGGIEGLRGATGGRPTGVVGEELQRCLANALGSSDSGLFDLNEEQRSVLSSACGDLLPQGFGDRSQDGGRGLPRFGEGDGAPGGFFGGRSGASGEFIRLDLASECVTNLLGREVTGPADVTREEIQQIFAGCLPAPAP